jgi:GT2 family glycosyltransferase
MDLFCGDAGGEAMKTVLVGSPIRQTPEVLLRFLASLERLTHASFEISFVFVDDNTDPASSELLTEFASMYSESVRILPAVGEVDGGYVRDNGTHQWPNGATWKVAAFKDKILHDSETDYVFLIDSDVLVHPDTIETLLADQKDVVSMVYWTSWQPNTTPMPQVWESGHYDMSAEFMEQLRTPGVYEVGGLGACTLISRAAIQAGASFREIKNLGLWGEDRHFCVRAVVLGISLFVDTKQPAYHVYRDSDLPGADRFLA